MVHVRPLREIVGDEVRDDAKRQPASLQLVALRDPLR